MALENLTPVIRPEKILNGDAIAPVTRKEYFMQKGAAGGSGLPSFESQDLGKVLTIGTISGPQSVIINAERFNFSDSGAVFNLSLTPEDLTRGEGITVRGGGTVMTSTGATNYDINWGFYDGSQGGLPTFYVIEDPSSVLNVYTGSLIYSNGSWRLEPPDESAVSSNPWIITFYIYDESIGPVWATPSGGNQLI